MDILNHIAQPAVSVVMPVYNGERTLKEAINSVLAQTFRDFELIICNDASSDNTYDILENIPDDRLKVLHNSSNLGEGPTRDRAIDIAHGVWVAVIDADDVWESERLETLLREADNSQDRMIFDDIIECHDTPSGLVPWRALRGKYAFGGNGIAGIDVPIEYYVCAKRLLIKPLFPLRLLRQNQVFHSCRKFGADTEFFLQLLSHGLKLRFIPKPMYHYRITPASATSLSSRSTMMREVLEETIGKFEHAPAVQAALRKKIDMITREEQYLPFVQELKKKNFYKAFQTACHSPWIISELFSRLWLSLYYQTHRIWHCGRTRGN